MSMAKSFFVTGFKNIILSDYKKMLRVDVKLNVFEKMFVIVLMSLLIRMCFSY